MKINLCELMMRTGLSERSAKIASSRYMNSRGVNPKTNGYMIGRTTAITIIKENARISFDDKVGIVAMLQGDYEDIPDRLKIPTISTIELNLNDYNFYKLFYLIYSADEILKEYPEINQKATDFAVNQKIMDM